MYVKKQMDILMRKLVTITSLSFKILMALVTAVANSFQRLLSFPRLQYLRVTCYIYSGYARVCISSLVVYKN